MSPLVGMSPLVVGLADAGGVLVGSSAALGASFATDNTDAILIASLVGSGVGLVGGGLLGSRWDRAGTNRDIALNLPSLRFPAHVALVPTTLAGREEAVPAVRLTVDRW